VAPPAVPEGQARGRGRRQQDQRQDQRGLHGGGGSSQRGQAQQAIKRHADQGDGNACAQHQPIAPVDMQRLLRRLGREVGIQPAAQPAEEHQQRQKAADGGAVDEGVLFAGQGQRQAGGRDIDPTLPPLPAQIQVAEDGDQQHHGPKYLIDVVAGVAAVVQQGRRKGDQQASEERAWLAQPGPRQPHGPDDAKAEQRGGQTRGHIADAEQHVGQRHGVVNERPVVDRIVLVALAAEQVVGEPGVLRLVVAGGAVVQQGQPQQQRHGQQPDPGDLLPVPGGHAQQGAVQPTGGLAIHRRLFVDQWCRVVHGRLVK